MTFISQHSVALCRVVTNIYKRKDDLYGEEAGPAHPAHKGQLRHGLALLMEQKSVKEVTVKELTDLVNINRSTFYLHYTDI